MSSKQQYKDALKRQKQTISEQKKEIETLEYTIKMLRIINEKPKKKPIVWWKFRK